MLLSLFKTVASLSHAKSAPENGFSINKFMIGFHRNIIQADTIEALRMVKNTILSHGSIFDVLISKDLLESVKLAKERYNHDFENKRKLKEADAEKLHMLAKKRIKKKKFKKKCNKSLRDFILKFIKFQIAQQLLMIERIHGGHVLYKAVT